MEWVMGVMGQDFYQETKRHQDLARIFGDRIRDHKSKQLFGFLQSLPTIDSYKMLLYKTNFEFFDISR